MTDTRTTLLCQSCGEELFGAEDVCPVCGHEVVGPRRGLLARIPLTLRQLALMVGGILIVVGSLLPWSTIEKADGAETVSGIESLPGIVSLVAGALIILLIPLTLRARWAAGWVAAVPLLISLYKGLTTDIAQLAGNTLSSTVEIGLFMVMIGSIVGFIFRFRLD
jgi:hypothetical protein